MGKQIYVYEVGETVYAEEDIRPVGIGGITVKKGTPGTIMARRFASDSVSYDVLFPDYHLPITIGKADKLAETPPGVSFFDIRTGVIEVKGITMSQIDDAETLIRSVGVGNMTEALIQLDAYLDWLRDRVEQFQNDPKTKSAVVAIQGEKAYYEHEETVQLVDGTRLTAARYGANDKIVFVADYPEEDDNDV